MARITGRVGRIHVVALIVGVLVLTALIAALVSAQPAAPGPMQPGFGNMPMFPMMGPQPGGGGVAMIAAGNRIYIAENGVLYKIDPETMTVEAELPYAGRPGVNPWGGPGQPGIVNPGAPQ